MFYIESVDWDLEKPLIEAYWYAYLGGYQEWRSIYYTLAIKIFQRASIQKETLNSKVDKVIVCCHQPHRCYNGIISGVDTVTGLKDLQEMNSHSSTLAWLLLQSMFTLTTTENNTGWFPNMVPSGKGTNSHLVTSWIHMKMQWFIFMKINHFSMDLAFLFLGCQRYHYMRASGLSDVLAWNPT